MGSRSRIRWHRVAKLALGMFGCLALFLGLPSLIRRPEPPPLDSDIGLAPVAASPEPVRSGHRPEPVRRVAKDRGPSRDRRRLVAVRRPRGSKSARPSTGSPVTGAPAPAPAPVPSPVPLPAADPAPTPAPPAPPAPPPARAAAPRPSPPTEFGFER